MINRDKLAEIEASGNPSEGVKLGVPANSRLEGSAGAALPRDIDALEEAFVRCHLLERREAGGGRWPFAGDAPWHLMLRETAAGDYGGEGTDGVSDARPPRVPLSRAEYAELADLRRWLQLVPDALARPGRPVLDGRHDRLLVWLVAGLIADGRAHERWSAVRGMMRTPLGTQALTGRYRVAMARAVVAMHGWPQHWVRRMAA